MTWRMGAPLMMGFLASCASDPTTGGMFWDERGSQKRIAALRQELGIESESARQAQNEARGTRRKYAVQNAPSAPVRKSPQSIPAKKSEITSVAASDGPSEEQLAAERDKLKTEIETLKEESRARQSGL